MERKSTEAENVFAFICQPKSVGFCEGGLIVLLIYIMTIEYGNFNKGKVVKTKRFGPFYCRGPYQSTGIPQETSLTIQEVTVNGEKIEVWNVDCPVANPPSSMYDKDGFLCCNGPDAKHNKRQCILLTPKHNL